MQNNICRANCDGRFNIVENKIKENIARIPNNLPDGSPNPNLYDNL